MGEEAPDEVRRPPPHCATFRYAASTLGVGRENLTEKHWIYYPEDTVFHRIFVQGNASPHCNPPGGFGLTCEITYSPRTSRCPATARTCRALHRDCPRSGFFAPRIPSGPPPSAICRIAYVVYDHARPRQRGLHPRVAGRARHPPGRPCTASGNTTIPTTRSWPARRPPSKYGRRTLRCQRRPRTPAILCSSRLRP